MTGGNGEKSGDMGEDDLLSSEDNLKSVSSSDHKQEDSDKEQDNPIFSAEETYDPEFVVGMLFSTKKEFRNIIHSHAAKIHRNIKITKNGNIRCYAKCVADDCDWKIHALKMGIEYSFVVREYSNKHKYGPMYHVKEVNTWLFEKYEQHFMSNPKRNVKGFKNDVVRGVDGCHLKGPQGGIMLTAAEVTQ
ncbi:UNVERIFIED_CONTAM: hypothetical protein Sradi_3662200 [Sesamum radiatum]|uniref:Transposase MuDR plant domain-containing protein n=1 Tax=Sesamum radiatum TaxID=300843 RepID=A0AAW2QJB6_SESRA